KANQSSQTNTHHSTPQNASSSTNQAYQQANAKVKSANRDPNHTPATKHKTPNAPHSQPARSQNQPTDQLSQQHEVQQLNRINSLHTADHKSQPNPEPGTVHKNFQNQQPRLNAPVTATPGAREITIHTKPSNAKSADPMFTKVWFRMNPPIFRGKVL